MFRIECGHNPAAARALRLRRAEIDGWLERRQSREVRREILRRLKICH